MSTEYDATNDLTAAHLHAHSKAVCIHPNPASSGYRLAYDEAHESFKAGWSARALLGIDWKAFDKGNGSTTKVVYETERMSDLLVVTIEQAAEMYALHCPAKHWELVKAAYIAGSRTTVAMKEDSLERERVAYREALVQITRANFAGPSTDVRREWTWAVAHGVLDRFRESKE